jgi:hypothetical protein
MHSPSLPSDAQTGARFFDHSKRDLGWAFNVSKRTPLLGSLTILDVSTDDTALAESLVSLDKARLFVQGSGPSAPSYIFVWASGYANGNHIRIQGMLDQ